MAGALDEGAILPGDNSSIISSGRRGGLCGLLMGEEREGVWGESVGGSSIAGALGGREGAIILARRTGEMGSWRAMVREGLASWRDALLCFLKPILLYVSMIFLLFVFLLFKRRGGDKRGGKRKETEKR